MNLRNLKVRQDIDRKAFVRTQQSLIEREAPARGGWRNFGAYYLPKAANSQNVATVGGSGSTVGS